MTAKVNDGTDCSQLDLICSAMGEQIERRACALVLATSRYSFGRALRLTLKVPLQRFTIYATSANSNFIEISTARVRSRFSRGVAAVGGSEPFYRKSLSGED